MFRWLVDQHGGFGGPVEIVQAALACQLLDDIGLAHVASGHQVRQPYATHVVQNNPPQAVATLKQP